MKEREGPDCRLLQEEIFVCVKSSLFENAFFQSAGKLCFFPEAKKWISLEKEADITRPGEIRFFTMVVVGVVLADRAC